MILANIHKKDFYILFTINFNLFLLYYCKSKKGQVLKKIILASLATVSLFGANHSLYKNSFEVVGGYTINSTESELSNNTSWGIRLNVNRDTPPDTIDMDAFQFTFDYSGDTEYHNSEIGLSSGDTGIFRVGANAMWYWDNDYDLTPYAIAGFGMQMFGEDDVNDNNSIFFGTLGLGVEYQVRGDFSLVAEAKTMLTANDTYYTTGSLGVKYSFGQGAPRGVPIGAPVMMPSGGQVGMPVGTAVGSPVAMPAGNNVPVGTVVSTTESPASAPIMYPGVRIQN